MRNPYLWAVAGSSTKVRPRAKTGIHIQELLDAVAAIAVEASPLLKHGTEPNGGPALEHPPGKSHVDANSARNAAGMRIGQDSYRKSNQKTVTLTTQKGGENENCRQKT